MKNWKTALWKRSSRVNLFFVSRFYKVVGGAKWKSPHFEFIFKRRAIARQEEISNKYSRSRSHIHIHIRTSEYTLCWVGGNQRKIDRDRHKQHYYFTLLIITTSLFSHLFSVVRPHIFLIFRLTPALISSRRLLNTRNQIRVFRIRIRKQQFITTNWIPC